MLANFLCYLGLIFVILGFVLIFYIESVPAVLTVGVGIFLVIIAFLIKFPISTENKIYGTNLDKHISGDFFLGIGSISSVEYYVLYEQISDNDFVRRQIPTQSTIIRELDIQTPYLITIISGYSIKYIIQVPKGTIIKQININL